MSGRTQATAGSVPHVGEQAAVPLLQQRPVRMLSFTRFSSRVAQNALNFGLVLLIVDETGRAFYSSVLVLALVLPATVAGIVAGAAADTFPKRLLVFVADLGRAAICIGFIMGSVTATSLYVVAMLLAATAQFATSAEAAILPAIVRRDELARANALGHAVGGVAQIVGFVVLTPIVLRLFKSADVLFGIAAALFVLAAFQALLIGRVRRADRPQVGGGTTGPWWKVGWIVMRSDPVVFHAAVELTLIAMSLTILGGLIPSYIQDVLGLPVEIGALVLTPAAIGVIAGLRLAGLLAHRVPHAALSSTGFVLFVALLLAVTFVNEEASFLAGYSTFSWLDSVDVGSFDGGGLVAMALVMPLGFAYAIVAVAGQTVLNDRVPLHLQGRVLAMQGAMAALAASAPVLAAGALADWIGVQPVMAVLALAIGVAAIANIGAIRGAREAALAR